jgi:hypothetical protein
MSSNAAAIWQRRRLVLLFSVYVYDCPEKIQIKKWTAG